LASWISTPRAVEQLDYVVYKWSAKGVYAEINPKGSWALQPLDHSGSV